MKKLLLISALVALVVTSHSQAPNAFNYQAILRNNDGTIKANESIALQISIIHGQTDGPPVYIEIHNTTTSDLGLVNLVIGEGTTSDDLSTVDWANGPYFLELEIDGSAMGTSQLLSVPYSLHSKQAETVLHETQTFALYGDITDEEARKKIQEEIGPNTKYVWVKYTTNLTTLDFSGITDLVEIEISINSSLSTVLFPDLENVYDEIRFDNNPELSNLDFSSLETTPHFIIQVSGLTSLLLPSLVTCYQFVVREGSSLTQVEIPNLIDFRRPANASGATFGILYNPLSSETVNSYLAHLVSILPNLPTNMTVNFECIPPAPPTGQGLIDKETLISNGIEVYTD